MNPSEHIHSPSTHESQGEGKPHEPSIKEGDLTQTTKQNVGNKPAGIFARTLRRLVPTPKISVHPQSTFSDSNEDKSVTHPKQQESQEIDYAKEVQVMRANVTAKLTAMREERKKNDDLAAASSAAASSAAAAANKGLDRRRAERSKFSNNFMGVFEPVVMDESNSGPSNPFSSTVKGSLEEGNVEDGPVTELDSKVSDTIALAQEEGPILEVDSPNDMLTNSEIEDVTKLREQIIKINKIERDIQGAPKDARNSGLTHGINSAFVPIMPKNYHVIDTSHLESWDQSNEPPERVINNREADTVKDIISLIPESSVDHAQVEEATESKRMSTTLSVESPKTPEKKIGRFRTWLTNTRESLRMLRSISASEQGWQNGQYKGDSSKPAEGITFEDDSKIFDDDDDDDNSSVTRSKSHQKMNANKMGAYTSIDDVTKRDRESIPGSVTRYIDGAYITAVPESTDQSPLTEKNTLLDATPLDIDFSESAFDVKGLYDDEDDTIPFVMKAEPQNPDDARFVPLETKEKAKNAREKIKKLIPNLLDKYDKLPLKGKLAVSGTLIAAGILANATGSTVLAAGVYTAGLGLRGAGSYLMGRGAGNVMRSYLGKKVPVEQELSKKQELAVNAVKLSTAVLAFVAGTWGSEYIRSVWPDFLNFSHSSTPAPAVVPEPSSAPVPLPAASAPLPSASDVIAQAPSLPSAEAITQTPTGIGATGGRLPTVDEIARAAERHAGFIVHNEVVVRKAGESLSKVLLHNGIYEIFKPEEIAKLSWQGKQNLLGNIINNLSVDQLKEVGVTSGKADLLKFGDKIDVTKLAKIAKDITVTVAGEKVPLLKRALELS